MLISQSFKLTFKCKTFSLPLWWCWSYLSPFDGWGYGETPRWSNSWTTLWGLNQRSKIEVEQKWHALLLCLKMEDQMDLTAIITLLV